VRRSRVTRAWRLAAALPILLGALLVACSGEEPSAGTPPPRPAPDFTLKRLDGDAVTLSDLRGKTVVIDFWATWCPPCEFQVPPLNALYEAHRDDESVAILGISVDTVGEEEVAAWVGEKQVQYPILIGDEGLARRFGAMGFPTLVVVAPDGRIHSQHIGLIEQEELEQELAKLRRGT